MIATIFDYGAGNLHSLTKALGASGARVIVEQDPTRAINTDLLVLPGVGAFPYAATQIAEAREAMRSAILNGLPTIGICLGMQLLFPSSEEGPGAGLGVVDGIVTRISAERVPHIGWNAVEKVDGSLVSTLSTAYYANSYCCRPTDESLVLAWTNHERDRFPAVIARGSIRGIQFHPEKSSSRGVGFLNDMIAEVMS